MDTFLLRVKPHSKFHFGETGIEENFCLAKSSNILHSDTLFSAIVSIHAQIFGNTEDFIEQLENSKLKLSSVYYCLEQEDERIYFLPKPVNCLTFKGKYKDIKAIKYISKEVWEAGISPDNWEGDESLVILQKKFLCTKEELKRLKIRDEEIPDLHFFYEHTSPKVKVHGENKSDSFYHETNLHIADNSHLESNPSVHFYFLMEYNPDFVYEDELYTCLNLLADTGIGGQRSTGAGQLTGIEKMKENSFRLTISSEETKECSVSMSIPRDEEEFQTVEAYSLTWRGGRALSRMEIENRGLTYRSPKNEDEEPIQTYLKLTRMIEEGAILTAPIEGKLQYIGPDNDEKAFIRFGHSLSLPIPASILSYNSSKT
jgi:CRISPR-associated protein Csm4